MGSLDNETQNKDKEIRHDLNNLAYLLKSLADLLAKIPNLPSHADTLIKGALKSTDEIINKLRGAKSESKEKTDAK